MIIHKKESKRHSHSEEGNRFKIHNHKCTMYPTKFMWEIFKTETIAANKRANKRSQLLEYQLWVQFNRIERNKRILPPYHWIFDAWHRVPILVQRKDMNRYTIRFTSHVQSSPRPGEKHTFDLMNQPSFTNITPTDLIHVPCFTLVELFQVFFEHGQHWVKPHGWCG